MEECAIVYELPLTGFESLDAAKYLSPIEREEIFRLPARKRAEKLYARLLIKMLLLERTELSRESLAFSRDRYQKPYLFAHPEICFGYTHTGNCAAAALCPVPVGIDAEGVRPPSKLVIERFFAENEKRFVLSGERQQAFCAIWTKKEAYAKMKGLGLRLPFSSFDTLSPEIEAKIVTKERENYFLSVCTEEPMRVLFEEKNAGQIERFFSSEIVSKKD